MNGTSRGLLVPTLNDASTSASAGASVRIPPLRNVNVTPSSSRSRNAPAPLPLELINDQESAHSQSQSQSASAPAYNDEPTRGRSTLSAPVEPASSLSSSTHREMKKPHLAISELVGAPADDDHTQVQLPSFVSLSVVEKSPQQTQLNLNNAYPSKRPRFESDSDLNRLLPKPVPKDDKQPIPLLPAMVTGLHEPPPSAALLPSMDLDERPGLHRNSASKMQVKDMLLKAENTTKRRPPEQMLNTPDLPNAELPPPLDDDDVSPDVDTPSTTTSFTHALQIPKKDPKVRRTRRKWTDAETQDLLAGVKKLGFGKWKQILSDPEFTFVDRTSIDLKDRFRVFAKDYPDTQLEAPSPDDAKRNSADLSSEPPGSRPPPGATPVNKQRRKRHPWTAEEDAALLQGVQKYGFQWTDIHNDQDLKLNHRRATDLRDRIRNLYPDGYKHAEARPLRAEVKKAEKAGKKETPAGTLYAPPGQMEAMNFPTNLSATTTTTQRNIDRRQTTSGKVPSIATITSYSTPDDLLSAPRPPPRRSKTVVEPEHSGITLPSLALGNGHDLDDWDTTLPPFMNFPDDI